MRYYRYTFVDSDTKTPVSIEPALSGPMLPDETIFLFSLENSFLTGVPVFFGKVSESYQAPHWFEEFVEEDLIRVLKQELIERVNVKLEEKLSTAKIEFEQKPLNCSSQNVSSLQQIIELSKFDKSVNRFYFKHESGLSKICLSQAEKLIACITKKIQAIYEWAFILTEDINCTTNLRELLKILEIIN